MMSHLQLAKYADGVGALAPLNELLTETHADPFPVLYQDYAELVGEDSYGQLVKLGLPQAHWHYDWLPQPDVDTLLDMAGHVYVRTETQRGTIRALATFEAYLVVSDIGEPLLPDSGIPFYPQRRGPIELDLVSMISVP